MGLIEWRFQEYNADREGCDLMKINQPLLQGPHNTRELGGYPVKDQFVTHFNRFLRSDSLSSLTESDRRLLSQKGLTLIVDLRSEMEQTQAPDPQLGVRHLSFPLLDHVHSGFGNKGLPSDMSQIYIDLLDRSQPTIRSLFEAMAETEGCILFHCTAGKDRTGVTAMLLLDLAGADEELIIEDYAASGKNLYPFLGPQIEMLESIGIFDPEALLGSPRKNMVRTLNHLRSEYGGAKRYLERIGVSLHNLERLENSFVERSES